MMRAQEPEYLRTEEGYTAKEPERPMSRLPIAVMDNELDELHEAVERLSYALESVLTPEHPSEKTTSDVATKEQNKIQSQLAEKLERNVMSIRRASNKVRALTERLEV